MRLSAAWLLTSVLVLASCDAEKAQPDEPSARDSGSGDASTAASADLEDATSAASATTSATRAATTAEATGRADTPVAPKKGLAHPDNNPDVVKQIEKVHDGCKWGGKEFVGSCKLLGEWVNWAAWPGRLDIKPTLVAALEDDDDAVRHLAAMGLEVIGTAPISDVEMATALFDALEEERNPKNCRGIAMQAAAVKLKETGLDERAKNVARAHPVSECRSTFVGGFADYNPQHYDLVVELAKTDADMAVRSKAVYAMRDGARKNEERQQNNCKIWLELIDDSGEDYVGRAVSLIGSTGTLDRPCVEQWDEMLKKVEALAAAGKAPTLISLGLTQLHDHSRATKKHKARVLVVMKKIIENVANDANLRASLLTIVGHEDGDGAAFAKKFLEDESEKVKKAAKKIVDGPSK